MGKGGQNLEAVSNNAIQKVKKITLEELAKHRTPSDGKSFFLTTVSCL
jgi:hypothetical protein